MSLVAKVLNRKKYLILSALTALSLLIFSTSFTQVASCAAATYYLPQNKSFLAETWKAGTAVALAPEIRIS